MDETPEQLAQIRREADQIDPYRYKKRGRWLAAIGLGAAASGLFWLVLEMKDSARNPCQRVRDHVCTQARTSPLCASYESILKESVDDPSPKMRGLLRKQCETKIARFKEEDGTTVK